MRVRITDMDVVASKCRPGFLLLELKGDDGLIGLAEAPLPRHPGPLLATLDAFKASHLLGLDATRPARIAHEWLAIESGEPCATTATAIALVETACWDLAAKSLNVPLHRLFGGAIRDRLPACAAGWEPGETSAEPLADAARRVVGHGYKVATHDPFIGTDGELTRSVVGRSIRSCEAVRAAVGPDVALWINFGGRFTPAEAIRLSRALERIEPAGILDPVAQTDRHALVAIAGRVAIPLAIGESIRHWSAAREAIVDGSLDLIQTDISTSCGFSATRTLAALGETHGMGIALRTRGGPISEAGAIHFGSSLPNLRFIEHRAALGTSPSSLWPTLIDGAFVLPDGPGIGVENTLHEAKSGVEST